MKQIELVWRELLYQAIEQKNNTFRQDHLAVKLECSVSTVNHALNPLRGLGIVHIGKRHSYLADGQRLLFYFATRRNLQKDIIYSTYSDLPVLEREGLMPAGVIATAYSACRMYFSISPADYDNIYFYSQDVQKIESRFPKNNKRAPNIFILKPDKLLFQYKIIPLSQVFADLWNLPEWYAKDFYESLLVNIKNKL